MPIIQKPKPLMLAGILGESCLEIPKYQRSYSWTSQQVDEFLSDLFESFDREEPWFLGILYVYPKDPGDPPVVRMLLDGQQRITTIFILLKELMLFHENVADNIELKNKLALYAVGEFKTRVFKPSSATPRLTLDIANQEKFAEYLGATNWKSAIINYQPKTDTFAASHGLLQSAVTQIRDRLKKLYADLSDRDSVFDGFESLVSYILNSIELVEIQVTGNETIYQIFENINDRGLHLSDSDKFKNLYCSLLTPEEIVLFEEKWFKLSRTVHSIGLDLDKDIFFFYYRSKGRDDGGRFYKRLRSEIASEKSKSKKRDALKRYFSEIQDMVNVAKAVLDVQLTQVYGKQADDPTKQLSKVVSVIVRMAWRTSPQFRVLVYTSYFAFKDRSDITEFKGFLENLMNSVRFYVSAALLGTKGNAVRPYTIDIAELVTDGNSVATAIASKDSLNFPNRFGTKKLDRISFNDNDLSSLCLLLIQANRNVEPIRAHDADQGWSLEHFVPKQFETHWNHLADDNFKKYAGKYNIQEPIQADDLRAKNKRRLQEFLGNKFYIGLGQNKLANNKSFEEKKKQYIAYGKPITMPDFSPFKTWDEYARFGVKDVLVRSNELYDILIQELRNLDLPTLKPKK